MDVSSQLHVPASLPSGKNADTKLISRLAGPHSPSERFLKGDKSLALVRIQTPDLPASSQANPAHLILVTKVCDLSPALCLLSPARMW
jgi:hypothetical protein